MFQDKKGKNIYTILENMAKSGGIMHELGVLCQIVKTVDRVTEQNNISRVHYIALEVGASSGFVPAYLHKLFPVAADDHPTLQHAELRIDTVSGTGLVIKEIGY